ncbi:MAG: DNA repair protein RecO [Bacilli bacterium]|nr:DNA repair protein RecO [Bacilli bacterium]
MDLSEGIILKSLPYLDQAKIVYVLTSEGKQSFILKGGTSLKSHTFPFQQELTKIAFSTQKNTFRGGKIIEFYPNIKENMEKMATALQIIEIAHDLGEHVNEKTVFYQFTSDILTLLEKKEHPKLLLSIYQLKNLYLLGLAPVFGHCVECGKEEDLVGFVLEAGGMKCHNCHTLTEPLVLDKTVEDMRRLYITKLPEMDFPSLANTIDIKRLQTLLKEFYLHFLGFRSKVFNILESIE